MGSITYDVELTSSIPPTKMFKALVLDTDNLLPKILPQAIKCTEIPEGDGGVGTVELPTSGEGGQYKSVKSVKYHVALDTENLTYNYDVVEEGDALTGILESMSYSVKVLPSLDGGSVCKNRSVYHTKGDAQITDEQIKVGKKKAIGMFKAVEAYKSKLV